MITRMSRNNCCKINLNIGQKMTFSCHFLDSVTLKNSVSEGHCRFNATEGQCIFNAIFFLTAVPYTTFILYFTVKPNVYQNLIKLVFSLI